MNILISVWNGQGETVKVSEQRRESVRSGENRWEPVRTGIEKWKQSKVDSLEPDVNLCHMDIYISVNRSELS